MASIKGWFENSVGVTDTCHVISGVDEANVGPVGCISGERGQWPSAKVSDSPVAGDPAVHHLSPARPSLSSFLPSNMHTSPDPKQENTSRHERPNQSSFALDRLMM